MKHVNKTILSVTYPIGANMTFNYDCFIRMAVNLFETGQKKFEKAKHVCLVCTGSSGSIGATILYGEIMKKYPHLREVRILYVRKENEVSHDGDGTDAAFNFKGYRTNTLYVMVDDFSNSGKSVERCFNAINYHKVKKFDFMVMSWTRSRAFSLIKNKKMTKVLISSLQL